MRKVIVSPHCSRPAYSARVVAALSNCIGIEDYHVVLSAEPVNQEVIDILRQAPFPDVEINVNRERLGCGRHIRDLVNYGFSLSDYVIVVEDDILLTEDALSFFEWADQFESDPTVMAALAWTRSTKSCDPYKCWLSPQFLFWGWAMWRDRWDPIYNDWDFESPDHHIQFGGIRAGRKIVTPHLSRSENIGAEGGVHVPSVAWHAENHTVEAAAWGVPLGQFYLTPESNGSILGGQLDAIQPD